MNKLLSGSAIWLIGVIWISVGYGQTKKKKKKEKNKNLETKIVVAKGTNGTFALGSPLKFSYQIRNKTYGPISAIIYCNIAHLQPRKFIKSKVRKVWIPARKTIKVDFQYFPSSPDFYLVSCGAKNYTGWLSNDYFVLGYAIDKLQAPLSKKQDFDQFWKNSLRFLRQVKPQYKMYRRKQLSTKDYTVYAVEMRSLGNMKIKGWYRVPTRGRKHPVIVQFPSLGGSFFNVQSLKDRPRYGVPSDFAVFSLNIRGHGNSKSVIKPQEDYMDFLTYNLKNHQQYVYRGAIMDCIRALDFLQTRPEIDQNRIAVEGASQGGGLSLITTALDSRVALCAADVPFLCDMTRLLKIVSNMKKAVDKYIKKNRGLSWWKVRQNLSYYDTKNFAAYIKVPLLMSVGLQDLTCPPLTCFATYNRIQAPKTYYVYPYGRHEGGGKKHRKLKFEWIRKQFGMVK
ncbi:MAG TPA: hypothetical protein DCS93_41940 [Microscillaceae bacterium]|nr:hypothetical protein [Microscillaceae bacterium]